MDVMAANDDDPLRVVAHADGDSVALADAVAVDQRVRECVDLVRELGERPPFVLVHEEDVVASLTRGRHDVAQRPRRVTEDRVGDPPYVDLGRLESLARRSDLGDGFLVAQHLNPSARYPRVLGREPRQACSVRACNQRTCTTSVQTAFNSGDVEALVALYEPDAWLFGPEGAVQGHDAIRQVWTGFIAMGGQIQMTTRYVVEHGDIAMLSNQWTSSIEGAPISATTAEVARRQRDGSWRYVIDNPDATGDLTG